MTKREQQMNLECRKAVRAYLAERIGVALGVEAITRGLARQGGFSAELVNDACHFLHGKNPPHVDCIDDPDGGGAHYWQITAEGVVAYEKGI